MRIEKYQSENSAELALYFKHQSACGIGVYRKDAIPNSNINPKIFEGVEFLARCKAWRIVHT